MTRRRDHLEQQLAKLERMSPAELRAQWDRLTGRPAPKLSPKLLRLAVGYEPQAHEHGGLSRRIGQDLAKLAAVAPDGLEQNENSERFANELVGLNGFERRVGPCAICGVSKKAIRFRSH